MPDSLTIVPPYNPFPHVNNPATYRLAFGANTLDVTANDTQGTAILAGAEYVARRVNQVGDSISTSLANFAASQATLSQAINTLVATLGEQTSINASLRDSVIRQFDSVAPALVASDELKQALEKLKTDILLEVDNRLRTHVP